MSKWIFLNVWLITLSILAYPGTVPDGKLVYSKPDFIYSLQNLSCGPLAVLSVFKVGSISIIVNG